MVHKVAPKFQILQNGFSMIEWASFSRSATRGPSIESTGFYDPSKMIPTSIRWILAERDGKTRAEINSVTSQLQGHAKAWVWVHTVSGVTNASKIAPNGSQ